MLGLGAIDHNRERSGVSHGDQIAFHQFGVERRLDVVGSSQGQVHLGQQSIDRTGPS